jgi:hypothetical protein
MAGPSTPLRGWISLHLQGNLEVEQGRVLLTPEDIGFSWTTAGVCPKNRELNGIGRIELDKIADPFLWNIEQFCHGLFGQHLALLDELIILFFPEDDIERDLICPSVFAADGFS